MGKKKGGSKRIFARKPETRRTVSQTRGVAARTYATRVRAEETAQMPYQDVTRTTQHWGTTRAGWLVS